MKRKYVLGALFFWLLYNSVFSILAMIWFKVNLKDWVFALPFAIGMTCIMMAVTVGNQNKHEQD